MLLIGQVDSHPSLMENRMEFYSVKVGSSFLGPSFLTVDAVNFGQNTWSKTTWSCKTWIVLTGLSRYPEVEKELLDPPGRKLYLLKVWYEALHLHATCICRYSKRS